MRIEVARRLIECWHKNSSVYVAVRIGLLEAGELWNATIIKQEIGGWINGGSRGKAYLHSYFSIVSNMLWDNKSDDECVNVLMTLRADKHAKPSMPREVQADKITIKWRDQAGPHSSDWKQVK